MRLSYQHAQGADNGLTRWLPTTAPSVWKEKPMSVRDGLAPSSTSTSTSTSTRALWVWDVSTPAATVELAAANGIVSLFVAVPPWLPESPLLPRLQELSQRARAAGIRVDALGGDPGWLHSLRWVVADWLRPAMGTGLFTGVHVDLEPYTTPDWRTDRAGVVHRCLDTLSVLVEAAKPAQVEADIPFWFHEVPAGRSTLDREVITRAAGVSVMAYRNTAAGADGTIALATPALMAATELGKPARVGQETTRLGSDPAQARQTFHGWTRSSMEAELAEVDAAFSGLAGYAGVALHDATGYAAMAP